MELREQLLHLEAIGLIEPAPNQPAAGFSFRHALIQEAAYYSLVKRDRQRLHRATGETLEAQNPNAADAAPLLARHFAEAGDTDRAIRYYGQAGHAAAARFANAEAIAHFTQLIELGADTAEPSVIVDAYLARGHALELSANDAAALENYEALEAWAKARGDRAGELAALTARGAIYVKPSVHHNKEQGRALAEQTLALAQAAGDGEVEARAWWILLQLHLAESRIPAAVEAGERALALARQQGARELVGYVLTDLNKAYGLSGQLALSDAAGQEARQIWRELGALNMLADNLASSAVGDVMTGEYVTALSLADEAHTVSASIGNLWNQAYSRFLVDLVYFEWGDIAQALAVADSARRLSEQAGFAYGRSQADFDRALILAYVGDLPSAIAIAEQMRSTADADAGYSGSWPLAEGLLAWLELRAGRLGDAQARLRAAGIPSDEAQLRQWFSPAYAFMGVLRAELALAEGEPERALAAATAVGAYFKEIGVRIFVADMLYWQGRARLALGQPAEAQAAWQEAQASAEDVGSRRMLWLILAERARLAEPPEAAQLWREAAAIVEHIAERAGAYAASFRARPEVREVVERARSSPNSP